MKKQKTSNMKKQSKIVVISKQLHSSMSSYSSNDEFVYTETVKSKINFSLDEGTIIKTKIKGLLHLNGETVSEVSENNKILKIFLKADETYYIFKRGLADGCTKEQMAALLKTYIDKGWSPDKPEISNMLYIQKHQIELLHREFIGYVIPEWSKDLNPQDYQGGLSDKLVNIPVLRDYLKRGGCHGYIGHSSRTYEIDRFLEKFLRENGYKLEIIAEFMTWRQGRHFADQLDGDNFDSSKETIQKELIPYVDSVIQGMQTQTETATT